MVLIGTADFNTISHDPRRRELSIDCSFPVTLRIEVEALEVHLEETAEVLGLARYQTSGDRDFATS